MATARKPFDHDLKLLRAMQHLQDFDTKARTWLGEEHYTLRYEYDPDARFGGASRPFRNQGFYMLGGSVFIPGQGPQTAPPSIEFGQGSMTAYATAEQPPPDPLSLLIGDTLHNMRSALDTLAFALALAHTNPLPQVLIEKSEFPIFGDEDKKGTPGMGANMFRDNGRVKIAGWHPDAQTAVELLQPYKAGNAFRRHPLWVLHELDRVNKHRLLHSTVATFAGTLWDIPQFRNIRCIGPGFTESLDGSIGTDTPISRICGIHPIDANAEMHVEIHPALQIAFAQGTPCVEQEAVVPTLLAIHTHIATEILPNLTGFL